MPEQTIIMPPGQTDEGQDLMWAIKDLLMAYDNGWLDRRYPQLSMGHHWGNLAVLQARDVVRRYESRHSALNPVEPQ